MNVQEYFDTLHELWDGQIVVTALGTNLDEWWRRTGDDGCFYMNAAMGFASSFAIGLSLSVPDHEVWLLDSDGGVAMNAGGLLTEASTQPGNLTHFVFDNHCYGCLSSNKLVNADQTDYAAIGRAAGIANVHAVTDAAALREAEVASRGRHGLVVADVEWDGSNADRFERQLELGYEGPEMKYRFGRAMERRTGRPVFGPRGC